MWFVRKQLLMYHFLIFFVLKWSKKCKHRRAGTVYVQQPPCSLLIKARRIAVCLPLSLLWFHMFNWGLLRSPTCFIVIIYMYRHWFDVWDRQALLHTEGEADFLLRDLEMPRQENASELFITIPEAKVDQIHCWIRLCENVPFYSSLQFVNLVSNQITV